MEKTSQWMEQCNHQLTSCRSIWTVTSAFTALHLLQARLSTIFWPFINQNRAKESPVPLIWKLMNLQEKTLCFHLQKPFSSAWTSLPPKNCCFVLLGPQMMLNSCSHGSCIVFEQTLPIEQIKRNIRWHKQKLLCGTTPISLFGMLFCPWDSGGFTSGFFRRHFPFFFHQTFCPSVCLLWPMKTLFVTKNWRVQSKLELCLQPSIVCANGTKLNEIACFLPEPTGGKIARMILILWRWFWLGYIPSLIQLRQKRKNLFTCGTCNKSPNAIISTN